MKMIKICDQAFFSGGRWGKGKGKKISPSPSPFPVPLPPSALPRKKVRSITGALCGLLSFVNRNVEINCDIVFTAMFQSVVPQNTPTLNSFVL